ncbi:MAG: hypothetical protein ACJA1Z_001938 [Patiriisocius sp.]|jgi:hypothetical protein
MKYILYFSILFLSLTSTGQINDTEKAASPQTIGIGNHLTGYPILKYVEEGEMNRYTFIYKNQEYVRGDDVKFFTFLSNDIGLDYFYEFLMDSFNNKEAREIRMGGVPIIAEKVKSSIKITVKHADQASGWFEVKEKQLERLFGKI